jgi:transcriptional regulator with XRE-family HTH domain
MSFGKTLQRIRVAKGMTQREVAHEMGMDYSYFSRLENDRFDSNPTRETIDKIAEALKCTDEERGELLAQAGRLNEDMEKVARIASKRPELGQLFQAAVKLSPEKIDEILRKMKAEVEANRKTKQKSK